MGPADMDRPDEHERPGASGGPGETEHSKGRSGQTFEDVPGRPRARNAHPPEDLPGIPPAEPQADLPVDPPQDGARDEPQDTPEDPPANPADPAGPPEPAGDVVASLPLPGHEPVGTHRQNRREATEEASTARPEPRQPSDVESEIGAPAGPISFVRRREIEAVHQEIELSTGDRDRALVGVRKYREALFANYFRPRSPFVVTWPDNLYIPADADYRAYWSTPAPDDHRYRYRWTNGHDGQPDGSDASEKTGQLFSWVNASAMDAGYIGFAGTGVTLVPRASLSSVTVTAEVDLVAESRWWFLPAGPIGFAAFSYRGTAYVAGWEIDPVTGAWELLSPFGSRTLFAFDETGKGGSAISSQRHAFADLSVTLQLRGSRTYAIGVALEAQISFECRDRSGTQYLPRPGDDVKLWASIAGIVPSITLTT
ncbi:hypothetical protein E3T61_02795 [Cryobacterium lactosi]|uniref:Uncharacterized protein n=1 Tax=Cryobacterium lactosi TaxID=1259202 RepID=A0A4R9BXW9_9MICO|nr:hypothetical protein [Cryobacterium lactosi]TFD93951.1 hypothetical protein E3T61_02795 [Cryobacterium lactosi]